MSAAGKGGIKGDAHACYWPRQQPYLRDAGVCCFSWPSAQSSQFTEDPISIVSVSVFYVANVSNLRNFDFIFLQKRKTIFFIETHDGGITFHLPLIQTFSIWEHLKLPARSEPSQVFFSRALFPRIYHTNECQASAYCYFLYIPVNQAPKPSTI